MLYHTRLQLAHTTIKVVALSLPIEKSWLTKNDRTDSSELKPNLIKHIAIRSKAMMHVILST